MPKFSWLMVGMLALAALACQDSSPADAQQSTAPSSDTVALPPTAPTAPALVDTASGPDSGQLIGALEQSLLDAGLVDIQSLDPSIRVSLKYSTTDNFLQRDVYGDLVRAYLQPEVATMLQEASDCLQSRHPNLRLLVFDGVRPRSVQRKMWDIVKGTDQQNYVASPTGGGGMHNYGAAVDLGLYHVDTGLVDMGTPFDFFGDLAQPRYEDRFLKEGGLSQTQVDNRRILRVCMLKAGFSGILSEWWHFNAFPKAVVREQYQIVE